MSRLLNCVKVLFGPIPPYFPQVFGLLSRSDWLELLTARCITKLLDHFRLNKVFHLHLGHLLVN